MLYCQEIRNGKIINFTEDEEVAVSLGWTNEVDEQEIEIAYDGQIYLKGYAHAKPEEVLAEEKRADRKRLLDDSDKRMLPDFPISAEEKEQWLLYREYLRNITDDPKFPHVDVLSFENWLGQIHSKEPVLGVK
nr:MAG TPA: tail assembly chaperone protein [Caudoviricetes sp.]